MAISATPDRDVPGEKISNRITTAELAAAVEQLRFVTDAAPLLISYVDAGMCYRFVNSSYAAWFQRTADDTLGQHVSAVVGEAAFAVIRPHLESALRGERVSYEAAVPYSKGGHRFVRTELVPDKLPGGAVRGLVGVVLDITDRHNAEERERFLAALSDRTRLLTDPSAVVEETVHAVGSFLNLSRYMYADIDAGAGTVTVYSDFRRDGNVFSVAGVWPLAAWGDVVRDLAAGHTVVNRDYQTDPRTVSDWEAIYEETDIRANVTVPLHRNGEWVAIFSAQMCGEARDWSEEEVSLLESVAHRMWLTLENARLRRSEQTALTRQRRFLRDVLFSLTAGKLSLCDTAEDLPAPLTPMSEEIILSRPEIRSLRKQVESVAETIRLPEDRTQDLLTGVGEGAMNAVVHAGGGIGRVFADTERGVVQVWIRDTGGGISEEALPRALEKGASTAGTLGHGFWMILHTCDRVWLLTGAGGTTIVLEQDRTAPEPEWLRDVDLGT
ncbi:MAG: PAS domain-containing protein [Akkermansiaceae bacterium]|nr:PAS domain-containing protein [Armatimonadota bacterium]